MQDKDLVSVMAVEDAAGWLHYLAITGAPKFLRAATAIGMVDKLLNVAEDTFDKFCGCGRILQRDVVSDCIKISQRGL